LARAEPPGAESVAEVDVGAVVVARLDEVHESEGVVRAGDRAAVSGLDHDVIAEPVAAESLGGHVRADLAHPSETDRHPGPGGDQRSGWRSASSWIRNSEAQIYTRTV
jgi:hypothetical protein